MSAKNQKGILNSLNPKNIDFIGSELQLKYTNNGRFQTKLGGLISFFVTFFVGLVIYSSFKNLLSTDSPVATVSNVYSRKAYRFDLFKEKMFFHFGLANKGITYLSKTQRDEINRFITLKGFVAHDKGYFPNRQRDVEYSFELVFKPCTEVTDKTILADIEWHKESKQIIDLFGLCPELAGGHDKYFVQGKIQDPPAYYISLFIFPCSLPDASQCASLDEFQGTFLYHTKTRKGFDASNYEEPLYTIVEFDGIEQIDPAISKLLYYKIRDNEVWDDTHDFFDKRLRAKTADYFVEYRDSRTRDVNKLHCDASILDVPLQTTCQPYLTISVASSGEKKVIVRSYPKFFNTLGEIGGTAEILIIFSCFIYFKYNSFYLSKYIKKEVFEIESLSRLTKKIFGRTKKSSAKIHPKSYAKAVGDEEADIGQQPRGLTSKKEEGTQHYLGGLRTKTLLKESEMSSKQLNSLLDKQIDENLSGVSLFRSLNELKILRKIFFKPRHKKLLPMVLLNLKHQETQKQAKEEKQSKLSVGRIQYHPEGLKEDITIDEALEQLKSETQKSDLDKVMDTFILEHLQANDSYKISQKPPPPNLSPPFKFSVPEAKQEEFSEIHFPGQGMSEPDSPRVSVNSIGGSSLRSIPAKMAKNPASPNPRKQLKMSNFRRMKSKKLSGSIKRMKVRNLNENSATRNQLQGGQLSRKFVNRKRSLFGLGA